MSVSLVRQRDQGAAEAPARRVGVRDLFGRLRSLVGRMPEDREATRRERLGEVCVVLGDARAIVERGWLQDRWYAVAPGATGADAVEALGALPPDGTEITGACVVGAVVQATRQRDPAADMPEAGAALDVLWDALQESRGLRGPGVAGRAVPRDLRAARVRDLTRWNDRPGRTRDEVLDLLDLATSRAIMEAVTPAVPLRA